MKYSVDRIEENTVVCEDSDGNIVNIPLALFPNNVREGDMVEKIDDKFIILNDETEERRKKLYNMQKSIFTKSKKE